MFMGRFMLWFMVNMVGMLSYILWLFCFIVIWLNLGRYVVNVCYVLILKMVMLFLMKVKVYRFVIISVFYC